MIDLRAASLLSILPPSLLDDDDARGMALALDPELREISATLAAAIIMPSIDTQPGPVLDAIAWGMRLDTLQLWDDATLEGKRRIVKVGYLIRRRSGTPYALRKIFELLPISAEVIEWWQEAAPPHTFRMVITVTGDPGLTLHTLQQIPELIERFARTSQGFAELSVTQESSGPLLPYPALTLGRQVEIGFGG